jgi:hypothetical protein
MFKPESSRTRIFTYEAASASFSTRNDSIFTGDRQSEPAQELTTLQMQQIHHNF